MDAISETPNSSAEQAEVLLITALIRKVVPIMCVVINRVRSTSFNLYQETNICSSSSSSRSSGDENDCTAQTLAEGEYMKGSDPEDDEQLQCVICLYDVIKGEKYRVLGDCKHGFHVDCIGAWLENNSTCPLCRCPVPNASMKQQPQQLNDEHHQPLHDAILSCFIAFLDHLCTWFLNPLGFDDPACDDPHYII